MDKTCSDSDLCGRSKEIDVLWTLLAFERRFQFRTLHTTHTATYTPIAKDAKNMCYKTA